MKGHVIVDTSVWIDFYNGVDNSPVNILKNIILSDVVVILPIVIQEILQGIKNKQLLKIVGDSILGFYFLNYDNYQAAYEAASIYREMRSKGVTVRSSNDCLIAWLSISNSFPLLHNDKDFDNIAKHTKLKIYKSIK